jgi:hypothetical protein
VVRLQRGSGCAVATAGRPWSEIANQPACSCSHGQSLDVVGALSLRVAIPVVNLGAFPFFGRASFFRPGRAHLRCTACRYGQGWRSAADLSLRAASIVRLGKYDGRRLKRANFWSRARSSALALAGAKPLSANVSGWGDKLLRHRSSTELRRQSSSASCAVSFSSLFP